MLLRCTRCAVVLNKWDLKEKDHRTFDQLVEETPGVHGIKMSPCFLFLH
jgi:predicted GTPase